MASAGTAYVDVRGDFSQINRQLAAQGRGLRSSFARYGKLAGAALAVGAGVAIKKSIEAASDLEESINKAGATFEKSAPKIEKWSKTTAESLGLSQQAALEGASSIGAMLKPMGIAPKEAARMSRSMTTLAADMASFNNEDPTEMLDRLRAGLSGESEPLKRFGTVLSETRVQQHAWKTGIAEAGEELTEQQKIMGRYSLVLRDTKDQQGDFARTSDSLANVQRRLKANLENAAASFGTVLLPVVKDAAEALNEFAKIIANPRLTSQEKISKVTDKIVRALADAAPQMFAAGGEMVRALIRGMLEAPPLGKLFLGAALIRAVGGKGAIRGLGSRMGITMGRGIALGVVISLPILLKEWHDFIARNRDEIRQTGADWGEWTVNALIDSLNAGTGLINKALPSFLEIPEIEKIDIQGPLESLRELEGKLKGHNQKMKELTARGMLATGQELDKGGRNARQALLPHWRDVLRDAGVKLEDVKDTTGRKLDQTRAVAERKGPGLRNKLAAPYNQAQGAAKDGLEALRDTTNKALQAFGAGKPVKFSISTHFPHWAGFGGLPKQQLGGMVVPGRGSGDKVPLQAMVEPGEGVFVLNRNAMGVLRALNDEFPRRQKGGIVELGRSLQRQGYLVGEHPAFGGVGRHATNSLHYTGQALDVNWVPVEQEKAKLDALHRRLQGMPGVIELLWQVADHFDHLHVALAKGASGALRGGIGNLPRPLVKGVGPGARLAQAAIDRARRAGNAFLSRQTVEGAEPGAGSGRYAALWRRAAPGNLDSLASVMAAIVMGESSGNAAAFNGIARGPYQFTEATWRDFGRGPWANAHDPLLATLAAVNVLQREGRAGLNRWDVFRFGTYRQFLQGGGELRRHGTDRLMRRLRRGRRRVAILDELIERAQTRAGLPRSPAGEELAGMEKAEQLGLYGRLLNRLQVQRNVLRVLVDRFKGRRERLEERVEGIRPSRAKGRERERLRERRGDVRDELGKAKGRLGALRDELVEIEGLTGRSGRIFATRAAIQELRAEPIGRFPGGMTLADFQAFVEAIRYGAFSRQLPSFHDGGWVRPPAGRDEMLARLQRGELVVPKGAAREPVLVDVDVYLDGKRIDDRVKVQIREHDRAGGLRYRAGVAPRP